MGDTYIYVLPFLIGMISDDLRHKINPVNLPPPSQTFCPNYYPDTSIYFLISDIIRQ